MNVGYTFSRAVILVSVETTTTTIHQLRGNEHVYKERENRALTILDNTKLKYIVKSNPRQMELCAESLELVLSTKIIHPR